MEQIINFEVSPIERNADGTLKKDGDGNPMGGKITEIAPATTYSISEDGTVTELTDINTPELSQEQKETYKNEINSRYSAYKTTVQQTVATANAKTVTPDNFAQGAKYESKEAAISAATKAGYTRSTQSGENQIVSQLNGDGTIQNIFIVNQDGRITASSTEAPTTTPTTPTTDQKAEKKSIIKKLSTYLEGSENSVSESRKYLQEEPKNKDPNKKSLYDYTSWLPEPKLGEYGEKNYWYKNRYENLPAAQPMDEGTWLWNPYTSIHYAKFSMCIPGLVYNYKKDQQIKCLYRNCIRNHLTSGTSITNCELAYKERECLYVESAQSKKYGMGGIFDKLVDLLIQKLPYILVGMVFAAFCLNYVVTGAHEECLETYAFGITAAGFHPVICGIKGTINTVMELMTIFSNGLSANNHEQELGGEDYCTSQNSLI